MKKKSPSDSQPYDEPVWVFPYSGMQVGDSFFIPTMKPSYLTYIIDTTAKKAGIRVRVYTTTEEGILGCRAWRVS